jgi:hypothetical protein
MPTRIAKIIVDTLPSTDIRGDPVGARLAVKSLRCICQNSLEAYTEGKVDCALSLLKHEPHNSGNIIDPIENVRSVVGPKLNLPIAGFLLQKLLVLNAVGKCRLVVKLLKANQSDQCG